MKVQTKDHITISRTEYEAFLAFKKVGEFKPSKTVVRKLMQAEVELKSGKTLSYGALVRKLGFGSK